MSGTADALWGLYEEGGFVMPWLLAAALVLWGAIGFRVATLRRGSSLPLRDLVKAMGSAQAQPIRGLIDAAVARCLSLGSSVGSGRAARLTLNAHLGDIHAELGRGSALIRAIVIAAPLTGLLGTVAGMIEVFSSLGDMALFSQSGGIAGGVAQALTTTQMGLAVAIPGTIAARLLDARARRMSGELDALVELVMEGQPCAA